jgi:heat shock protein beta
MEPALATTLGASSVAALRPRAARASALTSVAPRAARCARAVRWEAGRSRGRLLRVSCDAAVAEKPTEEEDAAEEKFEYQAEVSGGVGGSLVLVVLLVYAVLFYSISTARL